jgi:hypothetical protein
MNLSQTLKPFLGTSISDIFNPRLKTSRKVIESIHECTNSKEFRCAYCHDSVAVEYSKPIASGSRKAEPYLWVWNTSYLHSYIIERDRFFCSPVCYGKEMMIKKGTIKLNPLTLPFYQYFYSDEIQNAEDKREKIIELMLCSCLFGDGILEGAPFEIVYLLFFLSNMAASYHCEKQTKKSAKKRIKLEKIIEGDNE